MCVFIILPLLRSAEIPSEALEAYVAVVLLFVRMLYKGGQSLNTLLTVSRSQLKRGENQVFVPSKPLGQPLLMQYVRNCKLTWSEFLVLSTVFGLSCMLKGLNH